MTANGQVFGERFRLFLSACLEEGQWPPSGHPVPSALFETPGDWQAYELATVMLVSRAETAPRREALHQFLAPRAMRFWRNWSGLVTHDSVAFVGEQPATFTLRRLPRQVESDYLPLYLLTLYQYVRLNRLAGEIQSNRDSLREDWTNTTKFWNEFLDFRNHYWFAEPTPKPQGSDLYRKFQCAMNLPDLFREIREELAELQEYFEQQSEKNVEWRIRLLTWIGAGIAALSLVIAWFGMDLATIQYFLCFFLGRNCPEPLGNL